MTFTAGAAAERLAVSQRQVQRMIASSSMMDATGALGPIGRRIERVIRTC